MAKNFDPQLYLQFGGLVMSALEKVPQDLISPELREAYANDLSAAKKVLSAMTDEEKVEATQALGEASDVDKIP